VNARIVAVSGNTITAEIKDWRGNSLGNITVEASDGWVSDDTGVVPETPPWQFNGWGNEAVDDHIWELADEARLNAIAEANAEIRDSILQAWRKMTGGKQ
jgi:hypothetical protein